MSESFERRKAVESVPYDESFDWVELYSQPGFDIAEHPEYADALRTHEYLETLNYKMSELAGKKLLDLGAGDGRFVGVARQHGVDAVALDLDAPKVLENHAGSFVRGDVYKLPFGENTFDIVVSLWGPLTNPDWKHDQGVEVETNDDFARNYPAVAEAIRVLKPGGEIRFPVVMNYQPDFRNRNEADAEYKKALEQYAPIEFEAVHLATKETRDDPEGREHPDARDLVPVTCDEYVFILRKKEPKTV